MSDPPTRLSQYPLGRVRIACDQCGRTGSWSVARLAERFGAEIDLGELLRILTASCKWQSKTLPRRRQRKYVPFCLAHYPDLDEPDAPPEPTRPIFASSNRALAGADRA